MTDDDMTHDAIEDDADRIPARLEDALAPPGPLASVLVAAVFALLFGYGLFQALSNLVALPRIYETFGIAAATPWWALVVGVGVPPLFFFLAVLLGRGRALVNRALILAVGLGASNAVALSLAAFVAALQPAFAS